MNNSFLNYFLCQKSLNNAKKSSKTLIQFKFITSHTVSSVHNINEERGEANSEQNLIDATNVNICTFWQFYNFDFLFVIRNFVSKPSVFTVPVPSHDQLKAIRTR